MSVGTSRTLVELFARRVAESGDRVALHAPAGGRYAARTWREIAEDVCQRAGAFKRLGVSRGSPVIQIAENRYEWIVADLAIHLAGGVHVAVHATLSGPQMAFQILDTDARAVLLSGPAVAEALSQAQADWPGDVQFFSYEPLDRKIGGHRVQRWGDSVVAVHSAVPVESLTARAVERTQADDLATILYSSGTTG